MFSGSMVALVTPMHNNKIDLHSLQNLVEFHIESGTSAIIAAGTTGESGTLHYDEKILTIKTVVDQARERIPVIAGTAANSTEDCIALTNASMHCGAHAALIMTPAYIKPTQEGLYRHYSLIAQAVAMPIILYNVPSRTACDLLPETVMRLAKIANIIGIKEATGNMTRLQQLLQINDFDIYSGDDETAVEWMLAGACGVISVTANIIPKIMAKICSLSLNSKKDECLSLNKYILPLHKLLFIESNPIPVKWLLSNYGLIINELRMPLTTLDVAYHDNLLHAMQNIEKLEL